VDLREPRAGVYVVAGLLLMVIGCIAGAVFRAVR
jgi:hypothetical protein